MGGFLMTEMLKVDSFQYSSNLNFNGFPVNVSLEVTNKCNLRCTHCSHTHRSKMIKGDLLEGIFRKVRPHLGNEIRNISLNGLGEPLLYEKWESILRSCLDIENISVGFITNGVIPLKLADELPLDRLSITFSIDGASASTYGKIRNADVFDRVISNIKNISESRKKSGSSHPAMGAIFVVTKHNMHEMAGFVRLAHSLGLSHIVFSHLVAHIESQLIYDSAFFRQEEHDQYLVQALEEAGSLGLKVVHMGAFGSHINVPNYSQKGWLYKDKDGAVKCGMTEHWCMINYTGHVQVCCAPESLIAGDLRENSLSEIWNGAIYRKLKTGLSHSFERTCGHMCNLRQTISLNDIKGFWCKIFETYDYDPQKIIKQPYSVSELNGIYAAAIAVLRDGDARSALCRCDEILKTDPLIFEAENLKGIAFALLGEREKSVACFLRSNDIYKDYHMAISNLGVLSRHKSS
jgi:MoaA/NifB/PqqE/SkfB family radical SAM enzyme